ncbi:hypothetical protein HPB52_014058 [Rhipicephalus sanguineus]|uniref:DDE-1 domain-containing protein n=1 Tax=Rhipicephalus sanguineus TaxID=34632 RepID=A0A9D4PJI6_RHISA|nr:hypothetical protein HPB52_014058 [Rhipicephalus sanguineus]
MRVEARTPKGNLKKPLRQHVLDFVAEAWAAVPEETVARSLKGCGISNALDGSEDGDLHSRLANVGAVVPEDRGRFQAECCDLFSCNRLGGVFRCGCRRHSSLRGVHQVAQTAGEPLTLECMNGEKQAHTSGQRALDRHL